MTDTDALGHALRMAAAGFAVFPLRPGSKKPYSGEGVSVATTDAARIRQWFAERPQMNFGVSTTDRVVLDVDVKHGQPGLETLEKLGALPDTLQVVTPSGGLHIYFDLFHAGQSDLGPGVNVRSFNGYVVGPGSVVDGRPYRVSNDRPVADIPRHVAALLSAPGAKRGAAHRNPLVDLDSPGAIERATAYLRTGAPPAIGGRNNAGYKVACQLKDYGLSEGTIADLMLALWNARCEPPLDEWEVENLARNAWAHGQNAPGVAAPEADFEAIPDDALPEGVDAEEPPLFAPMDMNFSETDLEPTPWLVKGLLLRNNLTAIVAPGGVGKSSLALGLALSLAAGRVECLGFEAKEPDPINVVWISTEEDLSMLRKRVLGFAKHHGFSHRETAGRFHILNAERFVAMRREKATRELKRTISVRKLQEYAEHVNASLIVYDPFVELHEGDENSNNEMARVMDTLRAVCRNTRAAGIVVHHTRKAVADGAGDAAVARGGGAFVNNVRLCFTLFRASEEDIETTGLDPETAVAAFRLDRAKGNYVAPGRHTKWFRTVGVPIDAPGHEDDDAPAVEAIDVRGSAEMLRINLHSMIAPAIREAGENGFAEITLQRAIDACMCDPMLASKSSTSIRRTIETVFREAVMVDGFTVQLVAKDPTAKRKTWLLQGW